MARRKKSLTRELADFLVDYGVLPRALTAGEYIGLVLNSNRARLRRVYFQGLAFSQAQSSAPVPWPILAAACDSKEQVARLDLELNGARAQQEAGF